MNERVNAVDIDGKSSQGLGQVYTALNEWVALDGFLGASTALAVDARDTASVVSSSSLRVYDIPTNFNAIRMRMTGAVNVYDVLLANANLEEDHYTRAVTLTTTLGTQDSSVASQPFADSIVISNERWGSTWKSTGVAGDTYIAEVEVDLEGSSRIAIQCTTFGGAGIVEITGY